MYCEYAASPPFVCVPAFTPARMIVGRCFASNSKIRQPFRGRDVILTTIVSRMNDCVTLGSTGYPLAFAMKVDAGR